MHRTKILHLNFKNHLPLTLDNEILSSCQKYIIYIQQHNQGLTFNNFEVQIWINIALFETKAQQIAINTRVLCTGSLLKSI